MSMASASGSSRRGSSVLTSGEAGDRVAHDDRHDLLLDERHHLLEKPGVLELVGVEPLHQLLPGVHDDFTGQRQAAQAVEGAGVELERALVLELVEDVVLDLLE